MTTAPISVPMQQIRFEARVTKQVPLNYLLYLPKGYEESDTKRWPLILYLHGAGERGTNLSMVATHGPLKLVAAGKDLPFIIVGPQCLPPYRWEDDSLMVLLDDVESRHKVDRTRVYVTGLSMGGFGTWSLAVNFPERFAAAAPICGGGNGLDVLLSEGAHRQAILSLPIWAFHGAKDDVVPVSESERMMAALKRAGSTNTRLTVYPEADHDSFTRTYENPKLFDWFLAHQRQP